MINDNPMYEPYVTVSWCPADIKASRPNLSDDECKQLLEEISRHFEDRLIESGWEILEILIDMEIGYEEEEEEDN